MDGAACNLVPSNTNDVCSWSVPLLFQFKIRKKKYFVYSDVLVFSAQRRKLTLEQFWSCQKAVTTVESWFHSMFLPPSLPFSHPPSFSLTLCPTFVWFGTAAGVHYQLQEQPDHCTLNLATIICMLPWPFLDMRGICYYKKGNSKVVRAFICSWV